MRTAMSSSVTIPTSSSPSITGRRRIRCWTISAAASSRSISASPVTSGRETWSRTGSLAVSLVGEHPDREVAVGDHRDRVAARAADDDRADAAVAHQLGDGERVGVEAGGDDRPGS